MSCGGESLLDKVGDADLAAAEEGGDGVLLGLADLRLLVDGEGLELVEGDRLEALGQRVVGLDVSLVSCLHFSSFIYLLYY